jgi:hypothetical protein
MGRHGKTRDPGTLGMAHKIRRRLARQQTTCSYNIWKDRVLLIKSLVNWIACMFWKAFLVEFKFLGTSLSFVLRMEEVTGNYRYMQA